MVVPTRIGHALRRVFDQGVHVAAKAMYSLPSTRPKRHGIRVIRNVPYKPTGLTDHLLDVYQPDEEAPPGTLRPAVIYIHGGAFCMLSKDTHRVMAMPFAKRGYVVFNINYRLGPIHTYPAPLEDAVCALEWVLDNAKAYGADPKRLVIAGESAGGNLVTALTYLITHPTDEPFGKSIYARNVQLKAAIPIYGFLDLHDIQRFTERPKVPEWAKREITTAATSYVGKPIAEGAQRFPLASPLRLYEAEPIANARALPPFFIACGTADMLLDDSRRLKAALDKRGVLSDFHVFPGEVHGFNAMIWRDAAKTKWRALFHFLSQLNLLEQP